MNASLRRFLTPALLLVWAAAPLVLPSFYVTLLNYIGLYALVALGLVLLTGVGGLTSFGQAAFVGIGAYATAYLTTTPMAELSPWLGFFAQSPWLTLVFGWGVTLLLALALGSITLKLSGHYLPLGTMAWGLSLYYLFGTVSFLGRQTGLGGIPSVAFFGVLLDDGKSMFYLIWIFLLAGIFTARNLLDSREGRAIRALKGGIVMAEAMGVDTSRARMIIFVIAALQAATSGWLYAHLQHFVSPTPFGLHLGIEYLFMAVVGGAGYVWGAVVGAGIITILKHWLQEILPSLLGQSGNFETIVFGVMMILVLLRAREGLFPLLKRFVGGAPMIKIFDPASAPLPKRDMPPRGEVILDVRNVTKRFGGLVANNDLSFQVRAGEIMALIGPNGAGKSTMFNCISGVNPPTSGEILFRGEKVSGMESRDIARRGMSRTFQHVRLLPTMSVLENVAIGAHLRGHAGVIPAAWRLDRKEESRLLAEAARQIERVGLKEHMFDAAGSLALGKQRIVEIARALCADPSLLLLDEPAAGLRFLEKQSLAELLRKLREEGVGVLLVEHDMDFVMGLADRCTVMQFGQLLSAGTPEEIKKCPKVLEAYLGADE
ncbi:MAG: ATP-binding cassette domain-containing protein [Zoogloea sp.]|uniref:branched-chain amino acid ABC transporter ATP-binding protein/permease n=1 Tax=Zoogloea sp. TaxID=49181 RepID=UPI003F34E13B